MLGLLRGILSFLLTLAVVVFAISNRHEVALYWNPLVEIPFQIPLYLIALTFMATGFVLGALFSWMGESKVRRERRMQRREIKKLEKALEASNENHSATPPTDFFPALIKKIKH